MRIASTLALAIALGGMVVSGPALAQRNKKEEKAAQPKYTPAVQNALAAAQKAIGADDLATGEAKLAEAKPALVSDDDRFIFGSVQLQLAQKKNDQALIGESVDMMIASGKVPPANLPTLYAAQAKMAYNAKDYQKAQRSAEAARTAGSTDPDLVVPILVESMVRNGQTVQSLALLNQTVDQQLAAGASVPSEWYQRGMSISYAAKLPPAEAGPLHEQTLTLLKKWVAAYPTRRNWHDALFVYRDQYDLPTDIQVDLFRLARHAGALTGDAEYREYAENVYLRFPNEALEALNEGVSKGVVNANSKTGAAELITLTKGKIAQDKGSLAASDKAARTGANGRTALATADAYVTYGMYPQALELYKVALQKGGIDAPTAQLHQGWAQVLSGDTAGAKASFAQVTGPRKPIADYWLIHLDHPTQG